MGASRLAVGGAFSSAKGSKTKNFAPDHGLPAGSSPNACRSSGAMFSR